MATVKERYAARRQSGRGAEREFIIRQTTDDNDARNAMFASADCPLTVVVGGTDFVRIDVECGVEELGDGIWVGNAVWKSPWDGIQPSGSFTLAFDISGQSQKITASRSTTNSYVAAGKVKPNFKQAINVGQDGTIDGTEILVPFFTYTMTRTFRQEDVDQAYVLILAQIVGSVNNATYQGFSIGELLLTRVSGQQRSDNNWDITFSFAVSRNATGLVIGDITGIVKAGWDYLWVYYEETHDATTNRSHKIPVAAYVERVYLFTNYDLLDI